ncbi:MULTISPECIES: efflux RND transporter periplasmic adaptor subunit [unclassified Solwaraspora]|uniref:efflux RND transporter periplasmic adaptor subunit n=1 Tax=unclassified Solwaraspora TaxID=2627926 RepID=UPI00249BD94C|nr:MULTISPECIES: efflux RND transporter periplasmic adaptor subunit [unclassified Solwaraspora]WFE22619.1 efflux RND transporter periplasmic adaptor subunit [Solwaraspora sp. WMMD937]WJK33507.1 efflux RND transporter periplasmic adaptor subunit [Solwaraspora sp. WMMA2065]
MRLGSIRALVSRLPASRWLVAVAAGATLIPAGVVAYAVAVPTSTDDAVPVAMTQVDRGTVTVAIAAAGSVAPAEDRQLGFAVAGTVTRLDVRLGQDVAAGDVLAAVDDSNAAAAVEQAEEALTAAREALAEAQADARTDGTDTDVSTGCTTTALAAWTASDPSTSPTPEATRSATPDPSPTVGTTTSPAPSPTASVPAESPTPTPPATPANSPAAPTGDPGDRADGSDSGCGRAADGRSSGDPVLRARQQVTAAQLRLAAAEDDLAGTVISAPVDGKVLGVSGTVGSTVRAGDTFIELGAVAQMQVTASFPEADAARLSVGQPAVVTLATRPGEEFPAHLGQVDPVGSVDGQLVRYGVIVDFDDVPAGLLVGQSAGVRVVVDEVTDVVRVPVTAVSRSSVGGEDIVVVRDGSGVEQQRVVTVGVRGDQYVEVIDGLAVGDEVVDG